MLKAVSLMEFRDAGSALKADICMNSDEGGTGKEVRQVLQALGVKLKAPQPLPDGDKVVHYMQEKED